MVGRSDVISKDDEQAIQDAVAENYEALRHRLPYAKRYHDWWIEFMLSLARPEKKRGMILDNGCGIGLFFDKLPTAQTVIGLDLSHGMLVKARQRGDNLLQGDSMKLPFPDDCFDLVLARSLLHHLPDPESGVREMHRVLRHGGQVILADTNRSLINSAVRLIAYRRENFSEHHVNFAKRDYVDWVSRYFTLEHTLHFGYLAYPFGFPDMMGPFRNIAYPVRFVKILIGLDNILGRIPGVRTQSWGLILAGAKL